ncbi:MAG: NUDIX hydrolase [Parachlamydiaceae bacterium]
MNIKKSYQNLCEVHENEPNGFNPQVEVAACYLEIDNKLLLLQSSTRKSEPEAWGVPAGKLEKNERPCDAAKRELFEETGISIEHHSQIQSCGSLYIRKPEIEYVYHLFEVTIDKVPEIRLSDEHQSYVWASSEEIEQISLMSGAREALDRYRTSLEKKQKK